MKKFSANRQENLIALLYAAVVAGITLLLCSRASFLFPVDNWDDANSYFSMGKAMFNGRVLYRDIMDQKGPYLYLIYGLAYLLSPTNLHGMYVLEALGQTVVLFFAYKSIRLYTSAFWSGISLPFLAACMYSSRSFYWGGSAEELCLMFFAIPLYLLLKHYKEENSKPIRRRDIAICGLCTGIVFLVKYNSLGFFAAWMMIPILTRAFKRQWKDMLKDIGLFFGMWILTAIPWLIYFAVNNALFYFYQGYFYYNIFLYSNFERDGFELFDRLYKLAKIMYWLILTNTGYFVPIILGLFGTVISRKHCILEKLHIISLFAFTFIGIFIGGMDLPYYSVPLMIFAILGFAFVGELMNKWLSKPSLNRSFIIAISSGLCFALGLLITNTYSMNTQYRKQSKEDSYLTQLASYIPNGEETTLLNIGALDAGLYTVANIVPSQRWFQTQSIPTIDTWGAQEKYIREGLIEYVLAIDYQPEYMKEVGYELIATVTGSLHEESDSVYYLYRKRPIR